MSEPTKSSRDMGDTPNNLETTIDSSHTGREYTEKIKELDIEFTEDQKKRWVDAAQWSHKTVPPQILEQSPAQVSRKTLIQRDIVAEKEADLLFQDVEIIVEKIWASWDNLYIAIETRKPKPEHLSQALLSFLWPLWQECAGFPNNEPLKAWLNKFINSRLTSRRNGSKRNNHTATSTNDEQAQDSVPERSSDDRLLPKDLNLLRPMKIIASRSADWNGTQDLPPGETAYEISLQNLDKALGDLSYAADIIMDKLQAYPVNVDFKKEYLILLDSTGGLHFTLSGTKKNVKLLEVLREEHSRNEPSLKIRIQSHPWTFDLARDFSDNESDATDDEDTHTELAKISMRHLHELWTKPEKIEQGCVILLNGLPGTDKRNIAEAIKSRLPEQTTRIISEDPIVHAAGAVIPDNDDAHMELRGRLRGVMFATLTDQMVKQRVVKAIMIDCLLDDDRDVQVLAEHMRIARDADVPFYLINLKCKLEEQERRVREFPRAESSQNQPQDADLLRQLADSRLVDPNKLPGGLLDEVHVGYFELSTSGLAVDQILWKAMRNMDE